MTPPIQSCMSERQLFETEVARKLQHLAQWGTASTTLSHQERNQLHALSLCYQTLLLQSQLGVAVDAAMLQAANLQWESLASLDRDDPKGD